jgi:hypothetical protein
MPNDFDAFKEENSTDIGQKKLFETAVNLQG